MMRVIGMDIHRTFAEAVMIDGDRLIRLGRIKMSRDHLAAFAAKLTSEDHLVIEATGNAHAVVEAVAPFVGRVTSASHRESADQDGWVRGSAKRRCGCGRKCRAVVRP